MTREAWGLGLLLFFLTVAVLWGVNLLRDGFQSVNGKLDEIIRELGRK